jgi:hypothetical protein
MEKMDLSNITEAQIEAITFLERFTLSGTWKINKKTGLVDITGNFIIPSNYAIKDFSGIRFGKVTGNFYCSNNRLTSLVGAPQEVEGSFDCSKNRLTSLVGAPQKVGRYFYCSTNRLTSLEGAPQVVGCTFNCSYNKLTNLQGIPKVVGDVEFSYNAVGKKTLSLVYKTMREKKVEFWEALCMLKDDIDEVSWNKIIVGFEDKITPEAIRTYSIVSRYRNHFFN